MEWLVFSNFYCQALMNRWEKKFAYGYNSETNKNILLWFVVNAVMTALCLSNKYVRRKKSQEFRFFFKKNR